MEDSTNGHGEESAGPSARRQQEDAGHVAQYYHIHAGSGGGSIHVTTSEDAARQIALLQADIGRMRKEVERKDSTISNLRFRSYLEGLAEAERQATAAPPRSGTTGLLRAFFDKALAKAITDPTHPLHAVQLHYRQASDRSGIPSRQVKQKADDLFPHFSRNIHKYFESGDEFELPLNLDVHDALLAELLAALKPTPTRDSDSRVDAFVERARFV